MNYRKFILPVIIVSFSASSAFCQSEVLKGVVNSLAFYKQKKDLKYLAAAKKSVDSLITTKSDSADVQKGVYRAVVNSSILYIDSLNKLNQPANFLSQTTNLIDQLSANRKAFKYQSEIGYAKRCLANVYIRNAFGYVKKTDFNNALQLFLTAKKYAPGFKPLNAYIAYSNNKLGNMREAAKYYTNLVNSDTTKLEYVQEASNNYKLLGDTSAALAVIKKGRKLLPADKTLLLDEANIYANRKDYHSLAPLLPALLDNNPNNADIAFVAAVCYDHLNQYDKAESLYLHSIELNNSAYDPIFNLGLLYLKEAAKKQERGNTPDNKRAAQWLEKANEISPNNTNCLQMLQLAYAQAGDSEETDRVTNKLKQITNQ
ncbi:MAG: tetratricopeptide repeat protein [Mucilaginibacter sp.]